MAKPKIVVCIGSSCFSRGNERNVEVIQKYLEEHHLKDDPSARDAVQTARSWSWMDRSIQRSIAA